MELYTTFAAYNSHVYRHHRVALGLEEKYSSTGVCSLEGDVQYSESVNEESATLEGDNPGTSDVITRITPHTELSLPSAEAAKFLLKLREGYGVSQVAMIDIMDTCNEMCMQVVTNFKLEVQDRLMQTSICTDIIDDVLNKPMYHPFEGVDTIY